MSPTTCPSPDELADLLVGRLPPSALQRAAEHLEHCRECLADLQSLSRLANPLLDALRRPAADPYAQEAACRQAVVRFEALAQFLATTPHTPGDEGNRPEDGEAARSALAMVPERLGQYQLLEKLGQGGMGIVYRARHLKLERVVALKVLSAGGMSGGQAGPRFLQEMKALGKLSHPNIVAATDAGEVNGIPFLVMEFLEGTDLARLVKRRGPLGVPDACELTRQAALGLQHAHQHGLIHRDIKPSNLMLTSTGQVKVLDLGLARLQGGTGQGLTGPGQILGTADYIAPEQVFDTHPVDSRADLYSLGCTLYYLLTGQPPFSSPKHDSHGKKLLAHLRAPAPPVRERRPEVPPELAALLARLMAKDPAVRPATATEVAAALESFTKGCDLPQFLSAVGAAAPAPQQPPRRRRRRGMWIGLVMTCAMGLLVGLALFLFPNGWHSASTGKNGEAPLEETRHPVLEQLELFVQRERRVGAARRSVIAELVAGGAEQRAEPLDPLERGDGFRLTGRFHEPAYWYVVWFDTADRVSVEGWSEMLQVKLAYPSDDQVETINPKDPSGVHLILLVAGSVPPLEGKDLLPRCLGDLGKPPQVLPVRWAFHPRGAGGRKEAEAPAPSEFLQRTRERMPPGLEPVHAVFLEAKQ